MECFTKIKTVAACLLLLVVSVFAGTPVQVSWQAPLASPAITNYTLYYSTQTITNHGFGVSSVNVTNATSAWASNLLYSTTYHFVATSREASNESTNSPEVVYTTKDLPAPVSLQITFP